MNPGLGVILFGGIGYVLVYASVANHGRFALHPWAGLLADAYTGDTGASASSSSDTQPQAPATRPAVLAPATVLRGRGSPVRDRTLGVTA